MCSIMTEYLIFGLESLVIMCARTREFEDDSTLCQAIGTELFNIFNFNNFNSEKEHSYVF